MDKEYLEELFAPFGKVHMKRMFGGIGIFHRGLNFAAVMDGALRLKTDASTVSRFKSEGMEPFRFERKDGVPTETSYWQVPDRLLDDPEEFAGWAQEAFEVARRADVKKPPAKRKLQEPTRAG